MTKLISRPRRVESFLLIMTAVLVGGLYALATLGRGANLGIEVLIFLGFVFLLAIGAHIAVRNFAPKADPALLPLAILLNGIGYVVIARINSGLADSQAIWTSVGILVFALTLGFLKRVRDLANYRYIFALLGLVLLIAPIVLGTEKYGSKIWIILGPFSFQPGEIAKIVLAIFFASYVTEKRELLSLPTRRLGPIMIPDLKHFGPLLLAWLVALLVLVFENDFGSSLLFFTLFITVLYVGTGRVIYVLLSTLMLFVGAFLAVRTSSHVNQRIESWLDPWANFDTTGFQLIQSLYALAAGGIAGVGVGLGNPTKIPAVATDFIFSAIGEELGLIGATAILICFMLIIAIGLRIALRATIPFEKLLAIGLTSIIAIQTFVIIGGILRLFPLTGVTLPFVSYGGSSLVTNYVLLALLLRLSHDQTVSQEELGSTAIDPERVV